MKITDIAEPWLTYAKIALVVAILVAIFAAGYGLRGLVARAAAAEHAAKDAELAQGIAEAQSRLRDRLQATEDALQSETTYRLNEYAQYEKTLAEPRDVGSAVGRLCRRTEKTAGASPSVRDAGTAAGDVRSAGNTGDRSPDSEDTPEALGRDLVRAQVNRARQRTLVDTYLAVCKANKTTAGACP